MPVSEFYSLLLMESQCYKYTGENKGMVAGAAESSHLYLPVGMAWTFETWKLASGIHAS